MSFIVNGRRIGCRNSKWVVYLDDVSAADGGRRVPDFLVLAANNSRDDLLTGTAVLPLIGGGIGLMRNYRHPLGGWSWEMVKGFIDSGETPAEAAMRELGEETGHACAPADMIPLGTFTPESGAMAARGALFLARGCVPIAARDEEELGLGPLSIVPVEEALRMARESEIEDAPTVIALFRALPWLEATPV